MRTAWYPFEALDVFDELMRPLQAQNRARQAQQPEIYESTEGYFLSLDIPGVKRSDLEIDVSGAELKIKATRFFRRPDREPREEKFTKSFILPDDVDRQKIKAHFEDGVLTLALGRREEYESRKIEVLSGDHPLISGQSSS